MYVHAKIKMVHKEFLILCFHGNIFNKVAILSTNCAHLWSLLFHFLLLQIIIVVTPSISPQLLTKDFKYNSHYSSFFLFKEVFKIHRAAYK
jgi:hypothetical protein